MEQEYIKNDINLIIETIEEIRPFLNMDGGDIEFIKGFVKKSV